MKAIIVVSLLLAGMLLEAAERGAAQVQHKQGRYRVHADVLIALTPERVRAILTDYEKLPDINSGIETVTLEAGPENELRMRVQASACILFFCQPYDWVQTVKTLPSGDIFTVMETSEGSFRRGWVRYRLVLEGQQTRLIFDADLEPAFWVPPLIGPWAVKRKLIDEAFETAQGVERVASQRTFD